MVSKRKMLGALVTVSIFSSIALAADGGGSSDPTILSIFPPAIAIITAFLFRQVIPALFLGLWSGAWIVSGLTLEGLGSSLFRTIDTYAVTALADADHVAIIIFSLTIGGMVGVISNNGGMLGVVEKVARWATNRRKAQLGSAFMGLAIFFDDYTNTLVVGNTMRPLTDRLKVSREKLAYIVDSTAAPVASISLISVWIGYEVGLIDQAIENISGLESAYLIFLNTLAYSFYPILAILFVLMISFTGRDFGPMLRAEQRAVDAPDTADDMLDSLSDADDVTPLERKGIPDSLSGSDTVSMELPSRAINAVLPILVVIVTVFAGLIITGEGETIREILGTADSYKSLLWASLLGSIVAVALTVVQRLLNLEEAFDAWLEGMTSVAPAIVILALSWSLAEITSELRTADYLIALLAEDLPMEVLPMLTFIIAGLTALGTGSSWGTMAVLMPLVVPLAWAIIGGGDAPHPENMAVVYSAISCVLAGAVWGDHCSPISDTTILSSMASGCNHVEHVRTQLPYALLVGAVAILLGTLPAGFGIPWYVGLGVGAVTLWGILMLFGRRSMKKNAV
ncbi:sodium:proton antiporter [Kordiimonas sediminis]|uniref:Sodium:proton antiporter n=1 Tax=Kordiimonas sediminis TaxID=1735581 RepID=A0A919AK57_9PROT|nr:Na+/H+ antiporter NhaC family protein [Kordiimonas sediminis]GHF12071.1 sodium:proton antiporter [Kordiimonas sediminis]